MRRSLVIVAACVVALTVQTASAQLFGVGVKGGVNFANLSGDFIFREDGITVEPNLKTRPGFVIGASMRSRLLPLISLQPEILYSEKGAKFDLRGQDIGMPGASIDGSIDLKYLEVPILLRVGLPIPGFSPFVYAGPAFAYTLSAETTLEFRLAGFSETETQDIKDEVKNFDYGLVIGGGMEFGLPLIKIHAELRYTLGLRNIPDSDNDFDLKNGVLSLLVGVTI